MALASELPTDNNYEPTLTKMAAFSIQKLPHFVNPAWEALTSPLAAALEANPRGGGTTSGLLSGSGWPNPITCHMARAVWGFLRAQRRKAISL